VAVDLTIMGSSADHRRTIQRWCLVYGYDGAKRPISECNGTAGACSGASIDIERTYDSVGNVTNETQTITGADPAAAPPTSHTTDTATC
jgi:hypothetical protein